MFGSGLEACTMRSLLIKASSVDWRICVRSPSADSKVRLMYSFEGKVLSDLETCFPRAVGIRLPLKIFEAIMSRRNT